MTTATALTAALLDARENLITKADGEGKKLSVHMLTGVVSYNYMYEYRTVLKSTEARLLFLAWVGVVGSGEVLAFIKGCNRAAERKTLVGRQARVDAAFQYAGLAPKPEAPAKPHRHKRGCTCFRCIKEHMDTGCRSVYCKTCGF